jgi:hypothetical protein
MSSTPTPYTRKANFVSYEGGSPNNPKRGTDLDAEFDAIKTAADTTQSRLAEIQRGDGKLANDTVHIDAIPAATRTVLSADAAAAGAAAATAAATPLVAQATAQASLATTQATAAASSATAASNSKNAAAASATAASSSATAASTSATAASTSATNAATSKTGADNAKTGAETARAAAQEAQSQSEMARDLSIAASYSLSAGGGSAQVGYRRAPAAQARTVEARLRDLPVHVADYGAVGNGVTDDSAAIQAAINDAAAAGGRDVVFDAKQYAIGTGLVVSTANVYLRGVGYQKHGQEFGGGPTRWTQYGGTILKWIGPTSGGQTMLSFKPPVTGPALFGVGYEGIIIDGDAKASYGLELLSIQGGRFPRIMVADCTVRQIHIGCTPAASWTSTDPRDLQNTHFGAIFSRVWLTGALNADGVLIDGDDIADASICNFASIFYIHKNGYGLKIASSDSLNMQTVLGYRIAGGTSPGMIIAGGMSVTDFPRKSLFGFVQPGPGGLTTIANVVPPADLHISCYSLGNGTPLPVIDNGVGISYVTDTGEMRRTGRSTGLQTAVYFTPVSVGNIGKQAWQGLNSAGASVVYADILAGIVASGAGVETGRIAFETRVAGTSASRGYFQDGFVVGSTSTDKGGGTINVDNGYYVDGTKVMGARDTGWTAMTGVSGYKGAMTAAVAGTAPASYTQASLQAALNRIATLEARLRAHEAVFFAQGFMGA